MKGKDLIAVLEYARAFDKPKPRRRKKKEFYMNFDNLSEDALMAALDKHERKAAAIQKYFEDKAKANKKEEKKEEKKGWESYTFIQKMTILTATVPLAMMGYTLLVITFVKIAARAMGL